jgi:hypothetical protein
MPDLHHHHHHRKHSQASSSVPILLHTLVVKAPVLISVVPNGRDHRVVAEVGSVLDGKEISYAFIGKDTFCVLSFIRIGGRGRNRYASAGFVLAGRHHCSVRKVEQEKMESLF